MTMDEDYTIEEAVTIIRKAIERKKKEVADLE